MKQAIATVLALVVSASLLAAQTSIFGTGGGTSVFGGVTGGATSAAPLYVNGSNGTLGSLATPAFSVSTGNAILVFVRLNTNSTSVTGITDTAGNNYTEVDSQTNGGSRVFLWIDNSITGHASNVITAATSAGDAFPEVIAVQVSGQTTDAPVTAAMYSFSSLIAGMNIEYTLMLMFGEVAATGQTWTRSAGFTLGAQGTDAVLSSAYRRVETREAFDASLTVSGGAGRQGFIVLMQ